MRPDESPFGPEAGGQTLEQTSVVRLPGQASLIRPELPPDSYIEVAGAVALAPNAESTLYISWTDFGVVTMASLGAVDVSQSDLIRALTALKCKITISPGNKVLTLDGETTTWVSFLTMMGFDGLPKPFYRPIRQNDRWTIQVKNFSAGNTFTPSIGFQFRADESMRKVRARRS